MAIKYAPKPVVVAALRPGARRRLRDRFCTRRAARLRAELYMGLVEVGVGLIPGGGGCKEMLPALTDDPQSVFETIGYAKVSTVADDARKLGLLHKQRRHFDESGAADRRCQDARALVWRTTYEQRHAAQRRQGRRRRLAWRC